MFDRDYWPQEQLDEISASIEKHLDLLCFHSRKEIENYLLVPAALDRVLEKQAAEKERFGKGVKIALEKSVIVLERLSEALRVETQSQILSKRLQYFSKDSRDSSTITQETIEWFEEKWNSLETRLEIVSGKQLLQAFRTFTQETYGLTVTEAKIVEEISDKELSDGVREIAKKINDFCK